MKIALGAAKGLAFLHNDENKVIYRDFKTSNILLDTVSRCFSVAEFQFFDVFMKSLCNSSSSPLVDMWDLTCPFYDVVTEL